MKRKDFDWLTDEFMLYCRSTQLREKTMSSYEQSLHLFGRWCADELKIYTVDKITENVIRKYMDIFTLSKILGHSSVEVTEQAYHCPDSAATSNISIPFSRRIEDRLACPAVDERLPMM